MFIRPIIVVEDDPFPRMLKAFFDPHTEPARLAALADFFAHDLPDFAGWLAQLRATAGPLYPADVRLVSNQAELIAQLPHAEVIVTESLAIGMAEINKAPKLKVIQKYGTVLRGIDVAACEARDIKVLTLRRRANISCAEHALMLMLALSKKLHRLHGRISIEQLRAEGYQPKIFDSGYTPNSGWPRVPGLSILYGTTLGIIGFGEIGREIALRAHAFGMRVLCTQRTPMSAAEQHEWQVSYRERDALLAASDWLCIQLPANAGTRDYLDRAAFARIKRGAKLINVSRAQVVNRDALLDALRSGQLGGFALDPLYEEPGRADDELLSFENVILTPHVAAMPRFNGLSDFEDLVRAVATHLAAPISS
ncbi:MAG TPA: NAD(P)-dependent oxidoreductase [Burkholderiales bacterium]|nr:NAD(P)-dependent oxidoreductase [Burkholderiales bacterium]